MLAEGEAEGDQREVVKLAGRTGEERPLSGAAIPAAGEPQEPSSEQVAREMLLRDRELAPLPEEAELAQGGEDRVAEDGLDGERGEEPVERGVRTDVVVGRQRSASDSTVGGLGPALERHPSRLARGDASGEGGVHRVDAALVLSRVEPVAARRAHGVEQAVAPLPGPQELGADPGAPGELADPEVCSHEAHCTDYEQRFDRIGI